MATRFIGFRLRKELDNDLADTLSTMSNTEVSDLCRTALRVYLGITTQKEKVVTVEIKEIPVVAKGVKLFNKKIKSPTLDVEDV